MRKQIIPHIGVATLSAIEALITECKQQAIQSPLLGICSQYGLLWNCKWGMQEWESKTQREYQSFAPASHELSAACFHPKCSAVCLLVAATKCISIMCTCRWKGIRLKAGNGSFKIAAHQTGQCSTLQHEDVSQTKCVCTESCQVRGNIWHHSDCDTTGCFVCCAVRVLPIGMTVRQRRLTVGIAADQPQNDSSRHLSQRGFSLSCDGCVAVGAYSRSMQICMHMRQDIGAMSKPCRHCIVAWDWPQIWDLVQVTFLDVFVSGNHLVTNMTAIHSPHHNGSRPHVFQPEVA